MATPPDNQEIIITLGEHNALKKHEAAAKAAAEALKQANATIATLNAEIASLKATEPVAPAPVKAAVVAK